MPGVNWFILFCCFMLFNVLILLQCYYIIEQIYTIKRFDNQNRIFSIKIGEVFSQN